MVKLHIFYMHTLYDPGFPFLEKLGLREPSSMFGEALLQWQDGKEPKMFIKTRMSK